MTIFLWIISCILIYFFIGCITGLISLKIDGKALDKLDTDDIVMPLFL